MQDSFRSCPVESCELSGLHFCDHFMTIYFQQTDHKIDFKFIRCLPMPATKSATIPVVFWPLGWLGITCCTYPANPSPHWLHTWCWHGVGASILGLPTNGKSFILICGITAVIYLCIARLQYVDRTWRKWMCPTDISDDCNARKHRRYIILIYYAMMETCRI